MTVPAIAGLRLAIAAARIEHERLRRLANDAAAELAAANIELDRLGPEQELQARLDAARTAVMDAGTNASAAGSALADARAAYDAAAAAGPRLWTGDPDLPLLLLPVRLETVHRETEHGRELMIRVYPDDVHVDSHEPALTAQELEAGQQYWRAVWAAGPDPDRRALAWRALLDRLGLARAAWTLEALRPAGSPPEASTPVGDVAPDPGPFPDVASRTATWTRAPHTRLLPDRFVFSAYQDGQVVWREEGLDIPEQVAVGFAPPAVNEPPRPGGLPWDAASRWLVDYDAAESVGLALTVPDVSDDGYELLTVIGVIDDDDGEGTSAAWQETLRAHQYTDGLALLAVETPTTNTTATRAGWSSRPEPRSPEAVDRQLEAYEINSVQPAAFAASAFGIDGAAVLARAPGALSDHEEPDEILLRRWHEAIAALAGISDSFKGPHDPPAYVDVSAFDELAPVFEHFVRNVRARGLLPTLRIGQQPYGLLTVSSLDLWRGDDVHPLLIDNITSVLTTFQEMVDRVPQVRSDSDQDRVVLDLLSRRGLSRRMRGGERMRPDPSATRPPSLVGTATAETMFAEQSAPDPRFAGSIKSVDDKPSEELLAVLAMRPLANQARVLREYTQRLQLWDPVQGEPEPGVDPGAPLHDLLIQYQDLDAALIRLGMDDAREPFYDFANCLHSLWSLNSLAARAGRLESAGIELDEFDRKQWDLFRGASAAFSQTSDLLAELEGRAVADLRRVQRLLLEALDTLSHRIDAWVTSLPAARLLNLRIRRQEGVRVGAYGWLTDVQHSHGGPESDGYVITPSLHHATTAAVLRSGFLAHSDPRAMAVDSQSWRVRNALAVVDGVRSGQPLGVLLGYQFERALHDRGIDALIAGFRAAYPLAPTVDPDVDESARVSLGARDVVDGQALRRDLSAVDAAFAGSPGVAKPSVAALAQRTGPDDSLAVRRLLAELDETVDAVGDLLLAESVHHLVGGNALRAGLSADAIGRGEDIPQDFDSIRTPRSAEVVTYHLGLLGARGGGGGWSSDRRLAQLEPTIEGWCRARLRPAAGWAFPCDVRGPEDSPGLVTVTLDDLDLCALDVLASALPTGGGSPLLVRVLDRAGGLSAAAQLTGAGAERMRELVLLCESLRGIIAASSPLLISHLDPRRPDGWAAADLGELHDRVAPWLADVIAAREGLRGALAAPAPEARSAALAVLADLGVAAAGPATGADEAGRAGQILAALDAADLVALPAPPPTGAATPSEALAWGTAATAAVSAVLGEAVKVVPLLPSGLVTEAPPPGADGDRVADWLRDVARVRPRAAALHEALAAASLLAGADDGAFAVRQTGGRPGAPPGPWVATATGAQGAAARASTALQHDGDLDAPVGGLLVDAWAEPIPRVAGDHGPEEIAGMAFHYDRPGARAPQALLVALPPDLSRGWCLEDVHGVVEDTLMLARVRSLDLDDVPELRALLPMVLGNLNGMVIREL